MAKHVNAKGEVWKEGEAVKFSIISENNIKLATHTITNDPNDLEHYLRKLYKLLDEIYKIQGQKQFDIKFYYRPTIKYITIVLTSDSMKTRDGVVEKKESVRGHKGLFDDLRQILINEGKWQEETALHC